MMPRYMIRATVVARRVRTSEGTTRTDERLISTHERGPYRVRLWAAFVAWLDSYQNTRWAQRCEVVKVEEGGE